MLIRPLEQPINQKNQKYWQLMANKFDTKYTFLVCMSAWWVYDMKDCLYFKKVLHEIRKDLKG